MRYVLGLVRLIVNRSSAAPGVMIVRFAGVLLAVVLVVGVTLYSSAMSDAMLQSSLRNNQGSSTLVTSVGGAGLTSAHYDALDRYVRDGEARDLGLPLTNLSVHHGTSTMAIFHDNALGGAGAPAPLAYLTVDYYGGLADQVRVLAGSLAGPPHDTSQAAGVVVSEYTARSLHLGVGDTTGILS